MKRRVLKSAAVVAAALVAATCAGAAAFAGNSAVVVESRAPGVVFVPGDRNASKYSDSDLFDNFKNVMPGDRITQIVELKNSCPDIKRLTYSMKAEPHNADNLPVNGKDYVAMNDFLSRLDMTVKRNGDVVYRDSPDKADGLADFVEIATLGYGEKAKLEVVLEVPEDLEEKYMENRIGEVDWVFLAQEKEKKPFSPREPYTGDVNGAAFWSVTLASGIALLALAAILLAAIAKKKKKPEEDGRETAPPV